MNYETMWNELKNKFENGLDNSTELAWKHIYSGFLQWMNDIESKQQNRKYYLIIGGHIGYPVGRCTSEGIDDVHKEEPDALFYEISEVEFFNSEDEEYDKNEDWISISKTYEKIK